MTEPVLDRPVIGLSMYREQAKFRVWDTPADLLPARYAVSIESAGGIPVLLPPVADAAETVVSRLDGLVICGGNDIDPARYGAEPHERTVGWRPDRDAWELALLDAADAVGLPTLGICRGMQMMAVWAGGSLVQHLPDVVGDTGHSPGPDIYGDMAVKTVAGSQLQSLLGEEFSVRCHHHQAVADAPGYEVTAQAPDGTTEAMESDRHPFWLAVQWHPEQLEDFGLFRGLVRAAREPRESPVQR
jgi:putative glutamine amidotransferase